MPTYGKPNSSLQQGSRPTNALQYSTGDSHMRRRPQTAAPWVMYMPDIQ